MCLDKAHGKYLAFADFDDLSSCTRLGKQVRFLESHPEIGAVGSAMVMIDADGKRLGIRLAPETDKEIRGRFLQFNPISQPSIMARAQLVRKAGGYRK